MSPSFNVIISFSNYKALYVFGHLEDLSVLINTGIPFANKNYLLLIADCIPVWASWDWDLIFGAPASGWARRETGSESYITGWSAWTDINLRGKDCIERMYELSYSNVYIIKGVVEGRSINCNIGESSYVDKMKEIGF